MTFSRPEENTLGTVIGRRGKPRKTPSSPAARILGGAPTGSAILGTGYLGIGLSIVAGIEALFAFIAFLLRLDGYPYVLPATFAWLLMIVAFAAVALTIIIVGERMPHWLFIVVVAAIVAIIALDFIAIWPLQNIGATATAAASAPFLLLLALTMRRPAEIITVSVLVGVAFVTAIVLTTPLTAQTFPAQLGVVAFAIVPPLFGCWLVSRFRRMVELELDRVLVQSTVSAPRLAVGLLASEELARLDLDAEELFDSIAAGRIRLPLDAKTASIAASLATELRLHLLEGRRETWLYHAVTESEQLGRSVTLSDPASLAGLLDPDQRDGLLAGVWLLVSDKGKAAPSIRIDLGPVVPRVADDPSSQLHVPIRVSTDDISRNRIDPATWSALGRAGEVSVSHQGPTLRIDVDCLVASPSDQYHAEQGSHR